MADVHTDSEGIDTRDTVTNHNRSGVHWVGVGSIAVKLYIQSSCQTNPLCCACLHICHDSASKSTTQGMCGWPPVSSCVLGSWICAVAGKYSGRTVVQSYR